jgi:hypothetical protein
MKKEEKNKIIKNFDKLWKRLDEIEQEVNLGTFDNAVLALMIFIVALSLAILSMGIPESFKGSPLLL